MSLQPGSEDRPDDSALTPQDEPTGAPQPEEPTVADAPPPAPAAGDPWSAPPPPPAQAQPAFPPPPAPAPGAGAPPPAAYPPAPGAFPPPPAAYPPAPGAYPPPQGASAPPPPPAWNQAGAVPPPGAPAGYGGAWAAPQRPQTEGKAIVGLILAIGSFVVCPLVLSIVALVLASQSNRAIDASGGRLEGRGINTATKVISWINIALTVLAIIVGIVFLVAVANNPDFWDQFENLPATDTQF